MENQNKQEEQRKQDLFDVREHVRLAEMITRALCNIDFYLYKLKTADDDYKDLPSSREYHIKKLKVLLAEDFRLIELDHHKNYINTFAAFYRLHKSLKEQYEQEVLKKVGPQAVTLDKI